MNRMPEFKLSDFAVVVMGQSPKSEYYNSEHIGVPFLQGNRTFGHLYPNFDVWVSKPTKMAKKGEVLMSVRAPVGDLNFAPIDLCIGRGLCSISMKNGNNKFLYYLLKNNVSKIIASESGTVFGSVNKNTLDNIKLGKVFDYEKQQIISNILSSLDDKIELNNKINKTLEELAQTLYKHWFVDFEFSNEEGKPYKSSGGEMVESELGMIPSGWNVYSLSKVLKNVRTRTGERNLPVFSALKEGVLVLSSDFFNKNVPSKSLSKYLVVERGSFAYNPSRINIGSIGLNDFDFTGCVSPVYVVMKTESHYLYFFNEFFRTERFVQEVNLRASGSVRQSLSYSDLGMIKITYPPTELVIRFNDFYINFKDTIKNNLEQNIRIKQIRDLLLPKLMSGEIEV